jgi:3-keto-5-aminohexanoate cleavage enzyme
MMIAVAPNGARKQKEDHSALPITPAELAAAAFECSDAGASMIHLHVRDAQGAHSLDVDRYRAATAAVRDAAGDEMIIQVTTEAVGVYSIDQQIDMVQRLKPEAVSLAVRELCPQESDEVKAAHFFAWLQKERVAAQYILYSADDVRRFDALRRSGVIPGDTLSVLYVLGRYHEAGASSAAELLPMLGAMDSSVIWSVCAFGATEAVCMLVAAGLGGHARVGFENNIQLLQGSIAATNGALIAQVVDNLGAMARRAASGSEARSLLGMD